MDPVDGVVRRHVGVPVAMLRWPAEAARRRELAALGLPRLLLVDPEVPAPDVDDDEDWVRLPADERDVAARLAGLRARTDGVSLDGPVLHTGRGSVTLSPAEAAAVAVLLASPDAMVPRTVLEAAVAGHVAVTPRTVDGVVYRVRKRLRRLGLDVFAAPGRGYVLAARLDWPVPADVSMQ